ncbi:MAG: glycosyltransferase [Candidatus Aenigmatarchaeota archaeon]
MDKFSVLIPTYQEKERPYNLVKTILKDKIANKIDRIVIVTPDKSLILPKSKKILLILEKERKGKWYAIKLGLKAIKTKIVIMLSSDLKMRNNFLSFLLKHFKDPYIGMVVGRPLADKNSKIYPFSKIIWDLHHLLCLREPKGTEICGFRKILTNFPRICADEVFIEYKIKKAGYKISYEPRAFGYTKIPYTLLQLFRQRKRIFNGHLQVKKEYNFVVSSMKIHLILSAMFQLLKRQRSIKLFFVLAVLIFIEILARIFATLEAFSNKFEIIW